MRNFPGHEIVVVDPHNEALFYWLKAKRELAFEGAILVHIDKHSDMARNAPALERAKGENLALQNLTTVGDEEYISKCLRIDNHTVVACHQKAVSQVYWFNLRTEKARIYGGENGIATVVDNYFITWADGERPQYQEDSVDAALYSIQQSGKPIILDIDLDAFFCVRGELNLYGSEESIAMHTERMRYIIDRLPVNQVGLITIALSLNPSIWTPKDKADEFLATTMRILKDAGLAADDQAQDVSQGSIEQRVMAQRQEGGGIYLGGKRTTPAPRTGAWAAQELAAK